MKDSKLPGLSPVWLIGLAMTLGVFLVTAIPLIVGQAIGRPDWIGFSGNIVGATVTLLAAIVAWIAVRRTIETQTATARRQLLLDGLAILIKQAEVIEREYAMISEVELAAHFAQIPGTIFEGPTSILNASIPRGLAKAESSLLEIDRMRDKISQAVDRSWAFPELQTSRETITKLLILFSYAITGQIQTLKRMLAQPFDGPFRPVTLDDVNEIDATIIQADVIGRATASYAAALKILRHATHQKIADIRVELTI